MLNLKKKVLFGVSVSMVMAMAIGSFALGESQTPASPQAVGATAGPFTVIGGTQGADYDFTGTSGTNGVLTIHPQSAGTNITISNTGTTTDRIEVTSAATITLSGVNIDRSSITTTEPAALTITDNANFDVKILLADNTTNILKGAAGDSSSFVAGSPGIQKNGEGASIGTLTIGVPDGSAGTGKLHANGGYEGAGIGGGNNGSASNITITGGEVTATGGAGGAGIGGGSTGSGSNITITGGEVTATGGSGGAGIGGGYYRNGSNITINGGEVTANGGRNYAAGIGGGNNGSGSNITITGGVVTANGESQAAGIGGGGSGNGTGITISGGEVTANGGRNYAAGIGGGNNGRGSNITITGGVVTANGGSQAAGIGGGNGGSGSNITINGGEVTATGGENGAGIGGGWYGSGNNITISGGVVTANGGSQAAGIGGGDHGSGSGNSLNGDAVVLATSGNASKAALEGFVNDQQQSLLTKGIAFTGLGTAFDDKGHATAFSWDESGTMYGDSVTISQNVEFPANLTIGINQSNPQELIVDTNVTLTISAGATLQNEGILTISGTVDCLEDQATGTTGEVTTKTDFYREGSTDVYTTGYQTYKTSAGVQKYTNLPNPDNSNDTVFDSWFTKPGGPGGGGTKVDGTIDVLLNEHSFYEHRVATEYTITVADLENGSITPDVTEAAKDDTVTLTVTPDEGYQLKEGSLIVTDADGNEVPVTEEDGKYTFTMPGANVEISAVFELIPGPSVDPDQGGDGSDASSKTGDSFAGIAALAILGLATTGAVMLRKRK